MLTIDQFTAVQTCSGAMTCQLNGCQWTSTAGCGGLDTRQVSSEAFSPAPGTLREFQPAAKDLKVYFMATKQAITEKQNDELDLRYLPWLNHGCAGPSLYGDDGEMQCHSCRLDFKRDSVRDIELAFRVRVLVCGLCNRFGKRWVIDLGGGPGSLVQCIDCEGTGVDPRSPSSNTATSQPCKMEPK